MIRFACPSCQRSLSAGDDKIGKRFACPSCKNPIEVPAVSAAPTPAAAPMEALKAPSPAPAATASSPADPTSHEGAPLPLWQRALNEGTATGVATFFQTLKPITYVFEVFRRNRLRSYCKKAQFELGQRMHETQVGDPKLRTRIKALGERINNIQDVKGDAKPAIAERRELMMQLALPLLAAEKAPEAVEGEHERARTNMGKLQAQEESLAGALGGLMPPNRVAWRRVIVGYSLVLLMAMGGGWLFLLSRAAGDREAVAQAVHQDADEQQAEEDRAWDKEKDTEEIVEKCGPSVALIRYKVGENEGGGTGFMIRPGVIATNAHVISSVLAEDLKVYFPSAEGINKQAFKARVLYFDGKRDLAFLAVEPKVPALRVARNFEFKSGKDITIIGCPGVGEFQLENAVERGILSTKTEVKEVPFYQLGASVNPGNSGGPVFDDRGQVIGVVTLKASQERLAFCIPWKDLNDRIMKLEQEDPHKSAATGQSMHCLNVVFERLFVSSFIYAKIMSGYAQVIRDAAANGRSPKQAISRIQPLMNSIMERAGAYMMDSKHQDIGNSLLKNGHLPDEVRRSYTEVWRTFLQLKRAAEQPNTSAPNAYVTRVRQLENEFGKNITALAESLGFERESVEEDGF